MRLGVSVLATSTGKWQVKGGLLCCIHLRAGGPVAVAVMMAVAPYLSGADHGPVFGLAIPTNPQGGWSFDLGVNGRGGSAGISSTLEAELTYEESRPLGE